MESNSNGWSDNVNNIFNYDLLPVKENRRNSNKSMARALKQLKNY